MNEEELALLEALDESGESQEPVTLIVKLDPLTETVLSVEELA